MQTSKKKNEIGFNLCLFLDHGHIREFHGLLLLGPALEGTLEVLLTESLEFTTEQEVKKAK